METGCAIFIFVFNIRFCYIVYDSIPSEYTKLEESFGGFKNRSLLRFELEKSTSHTIVSGGTSTVKTYFVRQFLTLYQQSCFADQEQEQEQEKKV